VGPRHRRRHGRHQSLAVPTWPGWPRTEGVMTPPGPMCSHRARDSRRPRFLKDGTGPGTGYDAHVRGFPYPPPNQKLVPLPRVWSSARQSVFIARQKLPASSFQGDSQIGVPRARARRGPLGHFARPPPRRECR
jgi:hypothetical protein